ncbi:hypothetical protein HYZ98_05490 [Candidatus Peregrinibacteria bacterium]|nr:hypothetical protein [Candidatus Peregrinibacteria bacterium]
MSNADTEKDIPSANSGADSDQGKKNEPVVVRDRVRENLEKFLIEQDAKREAAGRLGARGWGGMGGDV